jgi:4-hydroxy-3-polyprenylbenzoate decarboxylase
MKTLAGVVSGYTDNLLLRAADVCLKEGRKVVLCPREMPLGRVHLRNLCQAAELGCAIVPPMLTFYNDPETIEDQINHVVGKVLLQFGIVSPDFRSWDGER